MRLLRDGSSQSDTVRPTSQRASATSGVQENSKWEPEAEVVVEEEQDSRSNSGLRSRSTGNSGDIWWRTGEGQHVSDIAMDTMVCTTITDLV